MHVKTLILYFLLIPSFLPGNHQVDSLNKLYTKNLKAERKVELEIQIASRYRFTNVDSAIVYAERARKNSENLSALNFKVEATLELIKAYIDKGSFDKAFALAQNLASLPEVNEAPGHHAELLSLTGYIYRRKGESANSENAYLKCLEISTGSDYLPGIAMAKKGLGDLLERQGAYQEALDQYFSALDIAASHNLSELNASILNAIGIIYDYQGNFDTAMEYYIKGLELARASGNIVKAAGISSNVASLQFYLEKDSVSLNYYKQSLELSRLSSSHRMEADALQGLFTVYKNMDSIETAFYYAKQDLELRQQMGDTRGLSYAYKNFGIYHQYKQEFKKAEAYYLKALAYAEQTDQKIKILTLNRQIGRLLNEDNRPREALPYHEKSLAIASELKARREQSLSYEDIAHTYFLMKKFDRAYEYKDLHLKSHNDYLSKEIHDQTVKLETLYKSRQKEEEIKNLQNEARLKEQLILRSRQVRNLSLLGLGGFVLISLLFYNRSRLKHKSNRILRDKNKEIQQQARVISESLEEKEVLLREIHHRVKNNLQIISSLLNLQSQKITDESLLAILTEGKNRVEAMSLIHQNLYKGEDLTTIVMQDYLEQLIQHLSQSFYTEGKEIIYDIDANNVTLDIDTAIPVGLIVNELVTNSYKHAFGQKNKGHLTITLKQNETEEFLLSVKDDGSGCPEPYIANEKKSLGLKLVHSLAEKQLKGHISISSNEGYKTEIKFSEILK